MPRPVSDSIADGLPLWDTYEAFFFLLTGITLGVILGFLFPSIWRSFRRRFRKLDRYKSDKWLAAPLENPLTAKLRPAEEGASEVDDAVLDTDLATLFVSARYAIQENALRDAAALYVQILGSEKVTRVQTNRAMYELSHVYALSGLNDKALETGLELLHRKPTHADVFRLLLSLTSQKGAEQRLEEILKIYVGPASGEFAREVAHILSGSALRLLREGPSDAQAQAVRLAKLAVRWSPTAVEPKVTLLEATSVLWRAADERPADQWLMGFCVDLAELARLKELNPTLSHLSLAAFLEAWRVRLDSLAPQVDELLQKMRGEISSQLRIDSTSEPSAGASGYQFLFDFLDTARGALASGGAVVGDVRPGWELFLRDILNVGAPAEAGPQLHQCSVCHEIQRSFEWRCRFCQRWETMTPLRLKTS